MQRIKYILKKIFFLPPLLTIVISLPSFLFVFFMLAIGEKGLPAYLAYGLSAYAMAITVTGITGIVQAVRSGIQNHPIIKKIASFPLGERFLKDVFFRTEISLYQGFLINLVYIIIELVSGIYYRSTWFIALAGYYILLAIMRFLLLRHVSKNTEEKNMKSELRRYRLCGMILLVMNLTLAGIVGFMVHQNRGYEYPGFLIYAMAAYAFYSVIFAVVNLVKFRKHGRPVLSAAKAINLVAAMVSILSLETAMLSQFGEEDGPVFRQWMTGATGGGVCVAVLGMAVFMIVRATKQLKRL